jgi:hypothetical protein
MPEIEVKEPIIAKVSEIQAKAEEIKTKRALPPKPGDRVSFENLREWLALLPPDAEERVTIWVYRMEPIINRQIVDPQANNNIDIIYNGFANLTEEYMISRHGGGTYKFVVKDEDKPKTQLGGFFEAKLSVPMIDNPPKLDLREVEWDNPKNKGYQRWARTQRLINENNMPVIERKEGEPTQSSGINSEMLKMMLDFTAKMSDKEQQAFKQKIGGEDAVSKSMNELFLEKLKQEDPNKQMNVVVSLITAMKQMQPEVKQDNTIAVMMPLLIKMMDDGRAAADRQMNLMLEFIKSSKSEPKEETDELDKLQKLLAIAKEIKGGPPAGEKTITESLLEFGQSVLPGVLTIVGNITAANAARNGATVPAQQPMNTTEAMNKENQNMTKTIPGLPQNEAAQYILQYGPVIIPKLAGEGYEFAIDVGNLFGDAAIASMVRFGPEKLMEAAKSVPQFWEQIEKTYGEAHLMKWLQSLCNYKEIVKQMEEEELGGETEPIVIKDANGLREVKK